MTIQSVQFATVARPSDASNALNKASMAQAGHFSKFRASGQAGPKPLTETILFVCST